jgi:hypothetical protein
MNQININLPAIKNIAIMGVRRTAVFMGLGINAANNPDFRQYELAKITSLEFIEPISDEKILTDFKTEFGRWVVGNGLRELIETFCIFLDEIHLVCLLMATSTEQISKDQFQTQNVKFRNYGLKGKLAHLNDDFNVTIGQSDYLMSINQARHCLTHRRGIVGTEDCFNGKELIVRWKGIDTYAETPSGERISLLPVPEGGVILSEGSKIMAAFPERTKIFPLGSLVTFSPRELAEICHFTLNQTNEVICAIEEYARNSGIPVIKPEATRNEAKS